MIRSLLARVVILAALSIYCLAGTSYVIVNNNPFGPNSVSAYKLDTANGSLSFYGKVATTGQGTGGSVVAVAQAITSDARCLFAIDSRSNDIAAFASPSYKLVGKFSNSALNFSNYAGGTIALSPNGRFLYGGYTGSLNIGAWRVNPNCSLTFIAAYVASIGADAYYGLGVSPNGSTLVVSAPDFQAAESFKIGSTGSLTDLGFVSFANVTSCIEAGCFPAAIDFTKDSKVVIFGNPSSQPSVMTASLGTSGTLTNPQEWDLPNSSGVAFSNAVFLSAQAYAGNGFLYVGMASGVVTAAFTENPLSITTVNSTAITLFAGGGLASTGNTLVLTEGGPPQDLATFRINSDGSLTPLSTVTVKAETRYGRQSTRTPGDEVRPSNQAKMRHATKRAYDGWINRLNRATRYRTCIETLKVQDFGTFPAMFLTNSILRRSLVVFTLITVNLLAQDKTVWSAQEQPIVDQIKTLRKLDDTVRTRTTKDLALQIRQLPVVPNKLKLAGALANLSTEGDFGRETLQEVTTTLATTLHEEFPPAKDGQPDELFVELASLVRYEHMQAECDNPQFAEAMAKLEADDAKRQTADFTLQDLQGKPWHLRDLKGKVVLVNFWATWCPPCRKEMPDLQALYDKYKDRGFLVLSISDEEAAKVSPFIAERKITYPVLLDPGRKVNDAFVVEGIPKSFVYDREGKMVAQSIDMRTRGQFQEMLAQAGLQ